ncbi:MAG: flagellar motor protein MotB [Gemmatimonadetes bacterium]|nr:flagellar motor protein MotB [Gemmatimonadota bacterium]
MSEYIEEEEEEEEAGGGWLTTWADMMSVLLTFFIVLQAFSTLSEKKFQMAVESIREAFSITLPVTSPGTPAFQPERNSAEELEESLAAEDVEGLSVEDYGDRMVVTVDSSMLFPLGEAALSTEGRRVMQEVTKALKETKGTIRVEGHTCNLRVSRGSPYPNNWWLSTARALTVLETLESDGVPSERLSAAGYGEYNPVAPNDGEANRRKNRRVEFVIEKKRKPTDRS